MIHRLMQQVRDLWSRPSLACQERDLFARMERLGERIEALAAERDAAVGRVRLLELSNDQIGREAMQQESRRREMRMQRGGR